MTLTLNSAPTAHRGTTTPAPPEPAQFPAEVDFIMSAMQAARGASPERRSTDRLQHRVVGRLRLFSDRREADPWEIFSRDASPRAMGFITRHRLPLGYGGVLKMVGPDGAEMALECTVNRCRETVHGWFEGSLSFNREQEQFLARPRSSREEARRASIASAMVPRSR